VKDEAVRRGRDREEGWSCLLYHKRRPVGAAHRRRRAMKYQCKSDVFRRRPLSLASLNHVVLLATGAAHKVFQIQIPDMEVTAAHDCLRMALLQDKPGFALAGP